MFSYWYKKWVYRSVDMINCFKISWKCTERKRVVCCTNTSEIASSCLLHCNKRGELVLQTSHNAVLALFLLIASSSQSVIETKLYGPTVRTYGLSHLLISTWLRSVAAVNRLVWMLCGILGQTPASMSTPSASSTSSVPANNLTQEEVLNLLSI